jgi:hypothetical protein
VADTAGLEQRLKWVDLLDAEPPVIHPHANNGAVWSTERSCYRFMAELLEPGSRTLETGVGVSTVLFTAWGCDHLAIVPFADEVAIIETYCDDHGIDHRSLEVDLRPSEVALPRVDRTDLDLVFVDGGHGFPLPVIDWYYGASLLRKGGVVVFDDVQLPQVRSLLQMFVDPDPRWERLAGTDKWAAYRRHSAGSLSEGEWMQPFFPEPPVPLRDRVRAVVPLAVKRRLYALGIR